jgi:sterol 3beta-glucosyltransferase
MDFTETIEVKIVDKDEQYTMDSYFFAYFHDLASALEQIREAILAYRHLPNNLSIPSAVQDTTITKQHLISPSSHSSIDQTQSLSSQPSSSSSSFKFTSLLRPFSLGDGTAHAHITRSASAPDGHIPDQDGFTHVTRLNQRPSSPSQRPPNTRLSSSSSQASERSAESPASTPTAHSAPVPHTYPPSPALGSPVLETPSASSSSWSVPVPTWLKTSSRRFMPSSLSGRTFEQSGAVSEVYEGITSHDTLDSRLSSETNEMGESDSNHHMGFSILETPDPDAPDHAAIEKFRSVFAFDEKETLLGCKFCLVIQLTNLRMLILFAKISEVTYSAFFPFTDDSTYPQIISVIVHLNHSPRLG